MAEIEFLMAKLATDSGFVSRQAEQQLILDKRIADLREAEQPLRAALEDIGVSVKSVWDLINEQGQRLDRSIPVLIKHLGVEYPDKVREGLARALASPKAKGYLELFVAEFKRLSSTANPGAKSGFAVAIASVIEDEQLGLLRDLLFDSSHGEARLLLLRALRQSNSLEARSMILDLEKMPFYSKEIRSWRA
jgi:hypothetical protein